MNHTVPNVTSRTLVTTHDRVNRNTKKLDEVENKNCSHISSGENAWLAISY